MKRVLLACLLLALSPSAAAAASTSADAGSAHATSDGTRASLANGHISRTWDRALTTSLRDRRSGRDWAAPGSSDFTIDIGGASTGPGSPWTLRSTTARREPLDPSRPARRRGVQIVQVFALDPVGLITLERVYTLRPGSSVIGVTSVLHNGSPAPLRVDSYALDQLSSNAKVSAGVLTYHGGSDWRDDYRLTKKEAGDFDDEGEVARFDDGSGSGWFFVSERRSGGMKRAGRSGAGPWGGGGPRRE